MPLPDSAPLSLQVSSNAVQSKPKRAMIVRMSAETLDALEAFPSHPPMAVDFGDNPGIYIGDTFFPMRPQKESSPHELYLRAASTAKPMAPLKLYANVIGKFMVERQLGDRISDKVRQQTMVAKQQHMERQAIILDQPPIPVSGSKSGKRKLPGSGTVVKKVSASDYLRPASPSGAASRKVSPFPQNPPSSKANADVRRRLVHCLAILPRLAEDAVRMVGGANTGTSTRQDLLALLEDVAEQQAPAKKGDKSPRPWALKPQTWTEVRPFEWPKLTEAERVNMARQARMAFKALKIPESHPAWENVRYRQTVHAVSTAVPAPPPMAASSSNRSSHSTHAETKRTAITTKEAKLKSKQDLPRAKAEIQMKDESTKATTSRVNTIKREDAERQMTPSDGSTGAKTVASRRLPGSGYQAKKSPQPPVGVVERSGTPMDARSKSSLSTQLPSRPTSVVPQPGGTHARKTIPSKATKKEDEAEREKERQQERQKERERERREKEKEKQREEWEKERDRAETEKREKARQKEREAAEREKRQRDKQHEREEMERERQKEREQEMEQERRRSEKERIVKERAAAGIVSTLKRKIVVPDTQETPDDPSPKQSQKRRKLEGGTSVASPSSQPRDARPKKPVHEPSPVPRLKVKKEPSPQVFERRATSTGGSALKLERPSRAGGSAKPRRRSPIYTSSEDEGEIPQPRKRNPSPPPVSERSNSSDQPSSERVPRHHRVPRPSYPPATDHAALRALYQSQYSSYLWTFGKVVAQKRKIEAMLNGDLDAEMDVMDPDELLKLSNEHMSLKTELENIHDLYTKGVMKAVAATGGGSMSD